MQLYLIVFTQTTVGDGQAHVPRLRRTPRKDSVALARMARAPTAVALLLACTWAAAAAAPNITSFTPLHGSYMGGTIVNVTGSGFLQTVRIDSATSSGVLPDACVYAAWAQTAGKMFLTFVYDVSRELPLWP